MAASDSVEDSGAAPEAILVRTSTTDPIATMRAASTELGDESLLAVLTALSQDQLERRLSEVGYDLDRSQVVDFVPRNDPTGRSTGSEAARIHGDVAGLSMELVRRFDGLAEEGGVVYLDSLEPFVSVAGSESAFRFLVIVGARARAAGIPLVARIDPEVVDPVAAGTLAEAFDRVVEGASATR